MERQEKVQEQAVAAKLVTQVSGRAGIRSPNRNRNCHPKVIRTQEEQTLHHLLPEVVLQVVVLQVVVLQAAVRQVVVHQAVVHQGVVLPEVVLQEVDPQLHQPHHQGHQGVLLAPAAQTHQTQARPRMGDTPLTRNERTVDYVES